MAYRVEIAETAERDIETIFLDMRERSPARAKIWFDGLAAKIEALKIFPARCALAPENAHFRREFGTCSTAESRLNIGFYSRSRRPTWFAYFMLGTAREPF